LILPDFNPHGSAGTAISPTPEWETGGPETHYIIDRKKIITITIEKQIEAITGLAFSQSSSRISAWSNFHTFRKKLIGHLPRLKRKESVYTSII
jgi:hypothetical protein